MSINTKELRAQANDQLEWEGNKAGVCAVNSGYLHEIANEIDSLRAEQRRLTAGTKWLASSKRKMQNWYMEQFKLLRRQARAGRKAARELLEVKSGTINYPHLDAALDACRETELIPKGMK